METGDTLKPTLSLVDLQRGWKITDATLKSGEVVKVHITGPSWETIAQIHLEHGEKADKVERALIEFSLPKQIEGEPRADWAWLEWLDLESRNELLRTVREFAYGFSAEKKRMEAIQSISKLWSAVRGKQRSSVSDSVSATPSSGPDPSSDSSLNGFAELKPTTVSARP